MQKIINVLALASFGVSAAVVAGVSYVAINADKLQEQAMENILNSLPIPEIPKAPEVPEVPELPSVEPEAAPSLPKPIVVPPL